ncbi:hypothetical protein [Nannocystis pusilla]|uniref:hypothetical protein n=1 Tax=Nannocystis pusilla TaxID=889268 RepID=UPI003BF364C4
MPTTPTLLRRLTSATLLAALAAEPASARASQQPEGLETPAAPMAEASADAAQQPEGPEAPAVAPMPEASADAALRQWTQQRRKLRIQLGVSAGFTAAFLLSGTLALAIPVSCPDDPLVDCEPYGRWIAAAVMFPAALVAAIPTAVYGVRLRRHNERRPVAHVQLAPGGLAIRF